jgi:hypothetical protein
MTPRRPVVEIMDDMMVDVLRKKTPAERLKIAFGMWNTARVIIRGAITTQHPDWSEDQVNREIAKRISHGAVDQWAASSRDALSPPAASASASR